jgi:hypothetical protein
VGVIDRLTDPTKFGGSPLALAMWMYEKFWEWTDNQGQPEDA